MADVATSWQLTTPDEVLRRAQEHAQRWMRASLVTDLCDQERIETLLRKRGEYLGLQPRKPVWCASFDELIQKIAQESSKTLLADKDFLLRCKKSVEREIMSQVETIVRKHSPATRSNDILQSLRERIKDSFAQGAEKKPKKSVKSQAQPTETIEHLKEKLTLHIRTLYVREKSKFGPIEELSNFWNELLNFFSCRFYDCLWECLPDKSKVKNYFAYMGEMHEAGLWVYIPSKTAEYLVPIPNRFFTGDAKSGRENAPKIEWRNDANQDKKPPTETPQTSQDTDRILRKLASFKENLGALSLDEEVIRETEKIVNKISSLFAQLKKEHPSSQLPYEIRRIADNWLIDPVTSYAKLSESNREKTRQKLLDALKLLNDRIDAALEGLELRKLEDFEVIMIFLRDMLGQNSLDAS